MVANAGKATVLLCDLQFHSPVVALDLMQPAFGRPLGEASLAGVLHTKV